MYITDPASR